MPVLHVPASLRSLSGGRDRFEVEGTTLRAVFRAAEAQCPELVGRIIEQDELRSDIAVAIDGTILDDGNLTQLLSNDAEIYLVPPIGGGCQVAPPRNRHRNAGALLRARILRCIRELLQIQIVGDADHFLVALLTRRGRRGQATEVEY